MRFLIATWLIVSVALAGCGGGSSPAVTAVAEPVAPAANNAGSVTSMGNNQVGQMLTAVVTDLDGANGTIRYQWFADGVAVAGASAETYDLTAADINADIRVRHRCQIQMGLCPRSVDWIPMFPQGKISICWAGT